MIDIDIRSINDNLRLKFRAMQAGEIKRATVRALNKTATTVRAKVGPIIREHYTVKSGSVRRRLVLQRATRAKPEAIIVAQARPIVLTSFRVNWRSRWTGARVKFRKDAPPAVLAGVFVRRTGAGQRLAFKRKGAPRLPLVVQTTAHLPDAELPEMFLDAAVTRANVALARDRYARVLEQELRYEFTRSAISAIKAGGGL